jgi:hypothetical protein
MDEDGKLGDQVTAREHELMDAERDALSFRSRVDLEKRAMEKRVEIVGH